MQQYHLPLFTVVFFYDDPHRTPYRIAGVLVHGTDHKSIRYILQDLNTSGIGVDPDQICPFAQTQLVPYTWQSRVELDPRHVDELSRPNYR